MTKDVFLASLETEFLPHYLERYPQFERHVREYISQIKSGQMGAHAWGSMTALIGGHAWAYGLNLKSLVEYAREQYHNCKREGKW